MVLLVRGVMEFIRAGVDLCDKLPDLAVSVPDLNTLIEGEAENQDHGNREQEAHPAEKAILDCKDAVKDLAYDQQRKSGKDYFRRPVGDEICELIPAGYDAHDSSKDGEGEISNKQ